MALPEHPNSREPWSPQETETLRRLAEAGYPPSVIAGRLGRSRASVSKQAEKLRGSIGRNSITRIAERRDARRGDAEGQAPG